MEKRIKHRNRKFSKSSFSRACLFLLPSLIGVLVLFVVPYLDVIRRSFLDGTGQRVPCKDTGRYDTYKVVGFCILAPLG